MLPTPPNAALSFFRNPVVLSHAVISGISRETGIESYGICLPAKQVPKQLATQLTVLISTNYLHVSAFYQLKSSAGDVRYYLLVIPRDDVADVRPYMSLYSMLRDNVRLDCGLFEPLALQLLDLLDTFSRLRYTHGAICPSNIYLSSGQLSIRLGPPMPFAAYLIDVERTTMIDSSVHSYDVCIPPECFLIYKSTINCLQPSTDAWMVGASLLYVVLGAKFIESHFTSSYSDYRVELITLLFHALGPPRQLGSLPLQREAEEKLISSFEGIVPYLDCSNQISFSGVFRLNSFRRSVIKRIITGLMTYDFNSRLRPGLALEIMKKEINRLEPTNCTPNCYSSSNHTAQSSRTTRQNLHACQKRRRSRSVSPHKRKSTSERCSSLAADAPSSHLCVETLARQPVNYRSKSSDTDIDELVKQVRSSIDYGAIATNIISTRALKQAMVPSPIESAKDIQIALQKEYDTRPSVEDLIIPSKASLSRDMASIKSLTVERDKPSERSNSVHYKRYSKVLREHVSKELACAERRLSGDRKPLAQSLQLSIDNPKIPRDSADEFDAVTPEYDRGDGLFVDSMDAPLLEITKELPLLSKSSDIKEHTQVPLPVTLASKTYQPVCLDNRYEPQISDDPIRNRSTGNKTAKDICTIVMHRLSTPYKAELNADFAVELKPVGHSSRSSFIGSMSNVKIAEPPDFGISVPTNVEIKVVSFDSALRDYSGILSGRLVVSINTPLNTCKVISFNLRIDIREMPKPQEWMLSTNGLASALLEVLY
ncbi:Hypothetical protein GLP15_119 [Giardia lamblia P15]|uniref:Protein kinase domain-containing protein n=1 Tax=Giardia intestinalis (strain P15) TaxID=658858 RepID=E1EX03_GIAIA|nr:Hypothetical protein GLP15_119 [Giardia lamblia P15]